MCYVRFFVIQYSFMFAIVLFVILVGGSNWIKAVAASTNNSCVPDIFQFNRCNPTVSFDFDCPTSTFNLAQHRNISSCSSVDIFWSYPMNNLTVIIQTMWTQKRRPYTIHLRAKYLKPQILHLYRINQGVEKEVKIRGNVIKEKSDKNYKVILKFQAPKTLQFYGVFIEYNVTKNWTDYPD